jgi:KUP system potassium uptake protein
VNWSLATACILLVIWRRESSHLAAAYGIAVTGSMAITSITYFTVTRRTWGWSIARSLPLLLLFLAFDLPFLGANLIKLFQGGYVPLVVAVVIFTLMSTWRRGRMLLARRLREAALRAQPAFDQLVSSWGSRVPGSAVVLTANPIGVPALLVHHAQHAHVLHETVVLLTVIIEHVPRIPLEKSVEVLDLHRGLYRVLIHHGFMQTPHIPRLLEQIAPEYDLPIDFDALTYYVGRERLLATNKGEMRQTRERLFALMSRNAASPDIFYCLPAEQVVEIGLQVDL